MKKNIFSGGMMSGVICESPSTSVEKALKNERFRRAEEEFSYKINPKLGELVEKKNNCYRTIENAQEAWTGIVNRVLEYRGDNFKVADHLYIQCAGFTHHGLYIGEGMVIHYSDGIIQKNTLEEFSSKKTIYVRSEERSPIKYSRSEVIARAKSRMYESQYNLIFNNCEHFVLWCRSGL